MRLLTPVNPGACSAIVPCADRFLVKEWSFRGMFDKNFYLTEKIICQTVDPFSSNKRMLYY